MPETADGFSGLVPLLRVRPELQLLCAFGAQWESPHAAEKDGWAPFHIVTEGACRLDVADHVGIVLKAGDVAILPHGGRHVTRALKDGRGSMAPIRTEKRPQDALLVKTNTDAEPDTRLVCGRLRFERAKDNMVLAALPAVVILSAADPDAARLRRLVQEIAAELSEDRLGAAAIAAELASALMVIVLRAHFDRAHRAPDTKGQGVLALLGNRQTARVLNAMLAEPARDWSLDDLAAGANTSRATLVRLFQKAVGQAPLAFLTELRLTLARNTLLAGDTPLSVVAETVGYQSETAFNRAYRRRFGTAPGSERKNRAK